MFGRVLGADYMRRVGPVNQVVPVNQVGRGLARFVYISFVFLITFRLRGNRYGGYIHAVCFIDMCQVPCRPSCRQAVGLLLLQALQVTFCPNMIHFPPK